MTNNTEKKLYDLVNELSFTELDTLEQYIRSIKPNSSGARIYNSDGDEQHQRESVKAIKEFFEDSFTKHHPGY